MSIIFNQNERLFYLDSIVKNSLRQLEFSLEATILQINI
jgi:hypothetical protein